MFLNRSCEDLKALRPQSHSLEDPKEEKLCLLKYWSKYTLSFPTVESAFSLGCLYDFYSRLLQLQLIYAIGSRDPIRTHQDADSETNKTSTAKLKKNGIRSGTMMQNNRKMFEPGTRAKRQDT